MNCVEDLYSVLSLSKEVDEAVYPILNKILKREKIQDCLEFLSLDSNQVKQEIIQVDNESLLGKEQIVKITNLLKIIKDHKFNVKIYSIDEYEEIKKNLILKISRDKKIIEFLKFLVQYTALDDRYILCGSNSLHLLVQMKVDLKKQCFEKIRISNTSLVGGNFVRCDLSGSEFDNVIISGINLNQAILLNCKWRGLGMNEEIKLNDHKGRVNQVCFSPNGKSLASCSDDKSIRLWDVKKGKITQLIRGKRQVLSVCFSTNNNTLAYTSREFVYLWNLKTGKQISQLDGHLEKCNCICFSPDSILLASGSDDNSIRLWDVQTRQLKAKLDAHSGTVTSVNFSPDGNTLASGIINEIHFIDYFAMALPQNQ